MFHIFVKEIDANFRTLISKADVLEYFSGLSRDYVAFDYETAAKNPKDAIVYDRAYIMGASFSYDPNQAVYIPFRHRENNAETDAINLTIEFIRDTPLVAYNNPFEYAFTRYHFGFEPKFFTDAMLVSNVYDSNLPNKLKVLIEVLFKYSMQTFEEVTQKSGDFSRVSVKDGFFYASSDSLWLIRLLDKLLPEIDADQGKKGILKLENKLSPIICDMHYCGVCLDKELLISFRPIIEKSVNGLIADLINEIKTVLPKYVEANLYGESLNINLNSPVQVLSLFKDLGFDLSEMGTGVKILKEIDNPIAKKLLAYRQESKILSTYIDAYLELMNSSNMIYPGIRQIGAPTGRMAGSSPNLMAIPKIRD